VELIYYRFPFFFIHKFTPAVYQRLIESFQFDILSTGQKSQIVNVHLEPSICFVLIKQSDFLSYCKFQIDNIIVK